MTDLEHGLRLLASVIEWPPTPPFEAPTLPVPAARGRRPLRRVLALAAALLVAAALVAALIPDARSAILHWFRIGGATVVRVETVPPAPARSFSTGLGQPVGLAAAEEALGPGLQLPRAARASQLYLRDAVVSTVLETAAGPVLLSEFRSNVGPGLVKKVAGSTTGVEFLDVVPGGFGVWITGPLHVVLFPAAPARLAGSVLLWERGEITYRLEGARLTKAAGLLLARAVTSG